MVCERRTLGFRNEVVQMDRDLFVEATRCKEIGEMILKDHVASESQSGPANPTFWHIQILAMTIRDDIIRGARAIDRCLDAFYLPTEAQAQKKKCSPDSADAIRLHGLGARW